MSPKTMLGSLERATASYFKNLSPEAEAEERELARWLGYDSIPAPLSEDRATRAPIEAGERARVSISAGVKAMLEELDGEG